MKWKNIYSFLRCDRSIIKALDVSMDCKINKFIVNINKTKIMHSKKRVRRIDKTRCDGKIIKVNEEIRIFGR